MTMITLNDVIKTHYDNDEEFKLHYDKEMLINAISKMVVKLRQEAKLTQAQLAKKAGTSQPVIARLESGHDSRLPSLLLLVRIAEASNAKLMLNFRI